MKKREYPIEIRDVSPGKGAIRLTGNRSGGGSDGFHTGGAWLYKGKVWKPLDGRPYANAKIHIETSEEECLTALQGKPLFPKNWTVEEANGRRFLVRDQVPVFPGGSLHLTREDVQYIAEGIRAMNASKWEVNDDLVIGKDRSAKLFIVDLSAAQYTTGSHAFAADDSSQVDKLCREAGVPEIPELKKIGSALSIQLIFSKTFTAKTFNKAQLKYIYSSQSPVEVKDTVPLNDLIKELNHSDQIIAKKYFWIASTKPLDAYTVKSKKLTLQRWPKGQ